MQAYATISSVLTNLTYKFSNIRKKVSFYLVNCRNFFKQFIVLITAPKDVCILFLCRSDLFIEFYLEAHLFVHKVFAIILHL